MYLHFIWYISCPLELDWTTSELRFGQQQEGILPELFCSSVIVQLSIVAQSFEQHIGLVNRI